MDTALREGLVRSWVFFLPTFHYTNNCVEIAVARPLSHSARKKDGAPHCIFCCEETDLADILVPVFQDFLQVGHELVGYGAVDEAVVVAHGEMDDGADGD